MYNNFNPATADNVKDIFITYIISLDLHITHSLPDRITLHKMYALIDTLGVEGLMPDIHFCLYA